MTQSDNKSSVSMPVAGVGTSQVRRVITTRSGGYSTGRYSGLNLSLDVGDNPVTVARNRARLAESIGLDENRVVYMEQLMSPHVTVVEADDDTAFVEPIPATDAIVTTATALALVALVADAVPVLLSDDEAGVIAAVNGSLLGVRNGIIGAVLDTMVKLGATQERIHALVGPSATGRRFLVEAAVADDLESRVPATASVSPEGHRGILVWIYGGELRISWSRQGVLGWPLIRGALLMMPLFIASTVKVLLGVKRELFGGPGYE